MYVSIAARIVLHNSSTPPSTQVLYILHWLPVRARIKFKIARVTYKTLSRPVSIRPRPYPALPSSSFTAFSASIYLILHVQTSQSEGEPTPLQLPTSGILFLYPSETPHHCIHSNTTSKHFTSNHHLLNLISHLATARASDSSSLLNYVRITSTPIIIIYYYYYYYSTATKKQTADAEGESSCPEVPPSREVVMYNRRLPAGFMVSYIDPMVT